MTLLRVYPKMGWCSRTLAKLSNDIIIGLTDKGNIWVTIYYKLNILYMKMVSEIMFRWC